MGLDSDNSDNGNKLDMLVGKALNTINEILDVDLPDESDPGFIKLLSTKKDAAVSIVNAGLKADENRFRKRNSDILTRLMAQMKSEGLAPAPLIEQTA